MNNRELTRVLLIESDPDDARQIRMLISGSGDPTVRVDSVASLADALRHVTSGLYDIVLSGLTLPDSFGLETYSRLKDANPFIPIIVLSGQDGERFALSAMREGAQDYLIKGEHDGNSFRRAIRHAIERRRHEEQLERLRSQQEHMAKLASIGEMAGGVAHEINTPLGTILLSAQCLRAALAQGGEPDSDDVGELLERIEKTVDRIARIVRSLRKLAHDGGNAPCQDRRVTDLVEDVTALCADRLRKQGVSLQFDAAAAKEITVACRESELSQVIVNLINNACDAVEGLPSRWIRIETEAKGEITEIRIIDSGPGISPEIRPRVFEPFFTTKQIGKGTGLGLSISRGIVESLCGSLCLDEARRETCFVIRLPRRVRQAEARLLEKAA